MRRSRCSPRMTSAGATSAVVRRLVAEVLDGPRADARVEPPGAQRRPCGSGCADRRRPCASRRLTAVASASGAPGSRRGRSRSSCASAFPRARITVVVLEDAAAAPELTAGARVVGAAGAVDALAGLRRARPLARRVDLPPGAAGRSRGTPIVTPTGLWLAERGGRDAIGVTATKGKSTTSSADRAPGRRGRPAGAPGREHRRPGARPARRSDDELAVIELSSYQIADLDGGPEVAMVANVYREHLNWHGPRGLPADKLRLLALPGVKRCVAQRAAAAGDGRAARTGRRVRSASLRAGMSATTASSRGRLSPCLATAPAARPPQRAEPLRRAHRARGARHRAAAAARRARRLCAARPPAADGPRARWRGRGSTTASPPSPEPPIAALASFPDRA